MGTASWDSPALPQWLWALCRLAPLSRPFALWTSCLRSRSRATCSTCDAGSCFCHGSSKGLRRPLLGGQHCLNLHLMKELEKRLQCKRWCSSQELGSHRIRTACFVREMLEDPCQLSHGQWFKLLCLLLGLLTNAGSCGWFVCLICHSCPQPCSRCVILSSRCF